MGRKWICFKQSYINDFKKIHYKVMKVFVEWKKKRKKAIYDQKNITCLINQPWNEKDINLHLSLIIMDLKL